MTAYEEDPYTQGYKAGKAASASALAEMDLELKRLLLAIGQRDAELRQAKYELEKLQNVYEQVYWEMVRLRDENDRLRAAGEGTKP